MVSLVGARFFTECRELGCCVFKTRFLLTQLSCVKEPRSESGSSVASIAEPLIDGVASLQSQFILTTISRPGVNIEAYCRDT